MTFYRQIDRIGAVSLPCVPTPLLQCEPQLIFYFKTVDEVSAGQVENKDVGGKINTT